MMRRCLCILTILVAVTTSALAAPKAPTVYVSGDGTGDFNCAGTSDQLQINEALVYVATHPGFTTVYLKGPRKYMINDTVVIDGNTTLTGDSTAAIKLVDHANWPTYRPLVKGKAKGLQNITVCGFEIDGNDGNNRDMDEKEGKVRYGGHDWYDLLSFDTVTNLSVHHMYLHNNLNDAMLAKRCKNVVYHHNIIDKPGHDGLYCYICENVLAYGNTFNNRINCSIRFAETNHAKAYDNVIQKADGGGAGIQIQRSNRGTVMNDVEVYNNTIHETNHAGIWIFCNDRSPYMKEQATGVRVHDNVLYSTGGAGINLTGFHGTVIENNVFDACGGGAGIQVAPPKQSGTGSETIIRNNIICNHRGAGIASSAAAGAAVVSANNCLFNNAGGNYRGQGIESRNDILDKDPMFIDAAAHDYRLKPGSPCINAGPRKADIGAHSQNR